MARPSARAGKKTKKQIVSKRPTPLFYVFLVILAIYAGVTLLGPVDPATLAKYNLSEARTHLLLTTVVVPFIGVWLTAFYGFSTFRRYAHIIKDTEEGPGFKEIATGLGFLAFSLPLNSCLSALMSWLILSHPSYTTPATITRNYLAMIFPLIAFILTSRGAAHLVGLLSSRQRRQPDIYKWILSAIVVSSLFTWMFIARPADTRLAENIYLLPNWLIVVTIAVPYVYTWFRGIVTVFNIGIYQKHVKGQLYRESLKQLSMGILTVIIGNILIQSITTVSTRLYRLQLTPILIIIYILIASYALGFGWIASGAKKMKKIEEV